MKSCGPCDLCCRVLDYTLDDGAHFPIGEMCKHAQPPAGCGIYETRPHVCQHFNCGWITSPVLPNALRPDRSHVVIAYHEQDGGRGVCLHVDADHPLAHREPAVFRVVVWLIQNGYSVTARIGGRLELVDREGVFTLLEASDA